MIEFFQNAAEKTELFFTDPGYQDVFDFSLMIMDLFNDFYLNSFFVLEMLISFLPSPS